MEISKEGDWEALLRAEEDWIKSTVDEILQARPAAAAGGVCGAAAVCASAPAGPDPARGASRRIARACAGIHVYGSVYSVC